MIFLSLILLTTMIMISYVRKGTDPCATLKL